MDKNSTPPTVTLISSSQQKSPPCPKNETLAKIRQFARAYSFASTSNRALGNLVLN
ncbi:hypothetical protein IMSAGC021_01499 [Muribaculaceae bacterium]|nr:hypothetical protein IMSAGC021_01499 [Muribaculaceae bacterium]